MRVLEAIILGLVQGFTEFIPVSSSGHLILVNEVFNFEVGSFVFDVFINIGTILALLIYFRKDIYGIVQSFFFNHNGKRQLGLYIAAATIPAILAGIALEPLAETVFRSTVLVAFMLILVSILMLMVDKLNGSKKLENVSLSNSLVVGVAQALALIPGVSRSGITIVAGLSQGLNRETAARFSFLLAIPILVGATLKVVLSDRGLSAINGEITLFIVGAVTSFISGYLAIAFLLRYLQRHSLKLFAWYRLGLAAVLLGMTLLR